jgi:DHA1 family bicyclomycin/chloramphenicol resistance-like MFS transporter
VVLLGALSALGPFSIDTYLPAFPTIASEFGVPVGRVGDSLAAYFLGICLGQLAYGPWMDRVGRRKPLLLGLGLYAVASLACALSPSVPALVALRLLQALGGCAGMVASRALVRDLFPTEAAQVFSSLMLVMGVAPVVAPTVGGWLLALAGWRSIFLFLAFVSLVLLAILSRRLPEVRPSAHGSVFDVRTLAAEWWEIFRHREFVRWGIGGSLAAGGLYAYLAGSPGAYMQDLGLSTGAYSRVFALNAAGLIGASQCNRPLLRRFRGETVAAGALVLQILSALALLVCAWLGFGSATYPLVWSTLFGLGLANPNLGALVLRPFGRAAGSASALMGSFQMAAGAGLAGLVGILPLRPTQAMSVALLCAAGGGAVLIGAAGLLPRNREPSSIG